MFFSGSALAQINQKDPYVCIAHGDQTNPAVARPSNTSSSIIVWEDGRTPDGGIYIQNIDTESGLPMWEVPDGIRVSSGNATATNPRAAYDSLGGVIVVWESLQSGYKEIHAQRVSTATGELDPAWGNGITICGGTNATAERPRIVGTGEGAFIVWMDWRNGWPVIQAQCVLASGNLLWTANGIPVAATTSGPQSNHEIDVDNVWRTPQGGLTRMGLVVVYEDQRNGTSNVYADAISRQGTRTWGDVAVDPQSVPQSNPQIVNTKFNQHGSVIVWQDGRFTNQDIWATVVDDAGFVSWPSSLRVCYDQADQFNPTLALVEAQNVNPYAVVTWEDLRSGNKDLFCNQINVLTQTTNTAAGSILAVEMGEQEHVSIDTYFDGDYHAFIVWDDYRSNIDKDIFCQDITVTSWNFNKPAGGLFVTHAKADQTYPQASAFAAFWSDDRRIGIDYDSQADRNIYGQRLGTIPCDAPTEMRWKDVYARWSRSTNAQNFKFVVDDTTGAAAYAVWDEMRSLPGVDDAVQGVFVQKIDSTGVPRWANNGLLLSSANVAASHPDVCKDGMGGAYVIWLEQNNGSSDTHVRIARVGADGTVLWTYLPAIKGQGNPEQAHDAVIAPIDRSDLLIDDGIFYGFVDLNIVYVGAVKADKKYYRLRNDAEIVVGARRFDLRMTKDLHAGAFLLSRSDGSYAASHIFDPENGIPDETDDVLLQYLSDQEFPGYDIVCDPVVSSSSGWNDALIAIASTRDQAFYDIVAYRYYHHPNSGWRFSEPQLLTDNNNPQALNPGDAKYPAVDASTSPTSLSRAMVVWDLERSAAPNYHEVQTNEAGWDWDVLNKVWFNLPTYPATNPLIVNLSDNTVTWPDIARGSVTNARAGYVVWENGEWPSCNAAPQVLAQLVEYQGPANIALKWGNPPTPQKISPSAVFTTQSRPIVKTSLDASVAWTFWKDTRAGADCFTGSRIFDEQIPFRAMGFGKSESVSNIAGKDGKVVMTLNQSIPNPVRIGESIRVSFDLEKDAFVRFRVYDALGRSVVETTHGFYPAGSNVLMWPGNTGQLSLSPGLYFYTLSTASSSQTKSFLVIR